MLLAFVFFGSILSSLFFFPDQANAADRGFRYTDDRFSAIVGELVDGETATFDKKDNKTYDADYPDHVGCHAIIHVNHAGAHSGTLELKDCTDGNESTSSISIADAKTFSGAWVDHSHIKVGGTVYYDNHLDDNDSYMATNQNNDCDTNVIEGFPHKGGDPDNATATATITINKPISATNTNCVSTDYPIKFTNTANYAVYFMWVDAGTIQTSDRTAMVYVQNGGSGPYLDNGTGRSSDSQCLSQIVPDNVGSRHGTLILRNSDGNPFPTGFSPQISGADLHDNSGCKVSDALRVNIGGTANATKPPGSGDAGGAGAGDAGENITDCDTELTSPLSWILCPLIDIGSNVSDFVFNDLAKPLLSDIPISTKRDNGTYRAWQGFRFLANIMLIGSMLAIVYAQARGEK